MAQKITATATDNLRALASFFMIDLLAGVLEIRTRGDTTGFRFFFCKSIFLRIKGCLTDTLQLSLTGRQTDFLELHIFLLLIRSMAGREVQIAG